MLSILLSKKYLLRRVLVSVPALPSRFYSALMLEGNGRKTFLFYEKEAEHQAPCYGKEMGPPLLPTRAWEAKKILLSYEVYKRA
jgi:hypothetical protein